MAGNKLSPRQKMIGMMYLVLTALLALNVSKEIIHAFVTINDSLEVTIANLSGKNTQAYAAFDTQMQNDKAKTEPFYLRAQKVKKLSADLDKYLTDLKTELIRKTDKLEANEKTVPLRELKQQDNYDVPTLIMCGDQNDGKGRKASELKNKIIDYKKGILAALDEKDRGKFTQRLDLLFNTKDPDPKTAEDGKRTWEMMNFYHAPVVATVALLTKTQSDVKNAESEIVSHLLSAINAADFKFDTLTPRVISPSSYVIEGQEYSAEIFLAAMSSTSDPEITVGGNKIEVANGVGTYKLRASGPGEKKYAGLIRIKKPDNSYQEFKFENSYTVAKPSSSVAADKMNVIYIGVDNPMTISVPGVADDKVKPIVTGFTLTPNPALGKGHYTAVATGQPGPAKVVVQAEFNGKPMTMGEFPFRLKRIPDPVAKVGGKRDGTISKSVLGAQQGIIPVMENFDFDLFSKVLSYKVTRYGRGIDPIEKNCDTGGTFTSDIKEQIIGKARPGDKILFEYIQVIMPDKTKRQINSIILTVQ